jgi:hypothetical protein
LIRRIGVIYQDQNSLGFLRGISDRLRCQAEFIDPPAAIGREQRLTGKHARDAWRYFRAKDVDLIVRFTDADGDRWQDIKRKEMSTFPNQASSLFVCGVAVDNPEDLLSLDPAYIAPILGVPPAHLTNPATRSGLVKSALARLTRNGEGASEIVARIVRDAPSPVFRRWLGDKALRTFYTDCRSAAKAADCETPSELDAAT